MTYEERLRGLREDSDLTQTQMGEFLNASQRAVSNWENGKTEPPYDILVKYAKHFRVSADYLLGITDTP